MKDVLQQLLDLMTPPIQTQHSADFGRNPGLSPEELAWRQQQQMPQQMPQQMQAPSHTVDPRMLLGAYNSIMKNGVPPPYSTNARHQPVSQWSPAAQQSLVKILLQRDNKKK